MPRDIQVFDVSVPVGGSATAPNITNINLGSRLVTGVEIVVPDGVRGTVHFALGNGGTRLIPSNANGYFSANGETLKYGLRGYHESGSWQFMAFNTGLYAHTLQVRFLLELPQERGGSAGVLLPASALSG